MCEIEWKRTPYNVTMGQCDDYEGRVEFKVRSVQPFDEEKKSWKIQREYIEIIGCNLWPFPLQGDYNQYECGLTVAAATAEDDGEWECDFESYVKVILFILFFGEFSFIFLW